MSTPEPVGQAPSPSPADARAQLDLTARSAVDPTHDFRILGLVALGGGLAIGAFAAAMVWADGDLPLMLVALGVVLVLIAPLGWWQGRTRGTPRHVDRILKTGQVAMVPALLWGAPLLERLGLERTWPMAVGAFVLAATPMLVSGSVVLRRGRGRP